MDSVPSYSCCIFLFIIHRGLDCKVCPVVVDEPDAVPGAGGGGGVVADPQVGEVGREVGEQRAHVVRVAGVELCRYQGRECSNSPSRRWSPGWRGRRAAAGTGWR